MKKSEQLLSAIREMFDPRFRIRPKESNLLGWIHSKIFGPAAAVILGHTLYASEVDLEDETRLAQLLAHEGAHVAQKKSLGALKFAWAYGFPQLRGLLLLMAGILGIVLFQVLSLNIGILYAGLALSLVGIRDLVNLKAYWRAILELEAYATAWWTLDIPPHVDQDKLFATFADNIHQKLCSFTYLYCGKKFPLDAMSFTLLSILETWHAESNENTELFRWYKKVQGIFLA